MFRLSTDGVDSAMHGLAVFLSTCAVAIAQAVTATAAAGTGLYVTCIAGPTNSLPAGTSLTLGNILTSQGSGAFGTAHATTTFPPVTIARYEVEARLLTDMGAAAGPFGHCYAFCGILGGLPFPCRNDVVLTLQAATAVRGRFAITYLSSPSANSTNIFWVDAGDDGSIEASNALVPQPLVPVTFGPGTLPLRMSNYLSVPDDSFFTANAGLEVRFVPDSGCTALQVAPACGTLSLAPQPNFTLGTDQVVQGLLPPGQSLAAVVYGFQPGPIPLPLPPGCALASTIDAVRLVFADASGRAEHSIATVPLVLRPVVVFAQALEFDIAQGTLTTSEAFRIDCR